MLGTEHIGKGGNISEIKEAIVSSFSDYLKHTPKFRRLAVVEGMGEPICMDSEEASFAVGEPLGTTFIAKNAGVKVISPEPRMEEQIDYLMSKGFGKYQIMLHFIVRQMARAIDAHRINEQVFLYMQRLATLMAGKKNDVDENYLMTLTIPSLNAAMKRIRGKKLFKLKNRLIYSNFTSKELSLLVNPILKTTKINEIAYCLTDFRDRKLMEEICKAVRAGKSPFIVYGISHVARLKPALDYLYGGA